VRYKNGNHTERQIVFNWRFNNKRYHNNWIFYNSEVTRMENQTTIKKYGHNKFKAFKIKLNNFLASFKKTTYNHKMIRTDIPNDWNNEY